MGNRVLKETLKKWNKYDLAKDPFYQAGIAEYDITEFIPNMVAEGFEKFQEQ